MDNPTKGTSDICIGIGYGEDIAVFTLKRITTAEEAAFQAQFADIRDVAEPEKSSREFAALVDALAEWSTLPPRKYDAVKKAPGEPIIGDTSKSIAEAVKEVLRVEGQDNHRIAEMAIAAYRSQLEPKVLFL